jgi:hypothetical protein
MNKSWKLTVAFAAVLVLVSAVYFFSNPPTSTKGPEDPRVLPGLTSEQVTKIEVDRKGTVLNFEKATDLVARSATPPSRRSSSRCCSGSIAS